MAMGWKWEQIFIKKVKNRLEYDYFISSVIAAFFENLYRGDSKLMKPLDFVST